MKASVLREDNGAARLDVFSVADFLPGKFKREAFLRRNAAGTFKLERKPHAGRCNRPEFERLHLRGLKVSAHVRIGAESPFDQKKLRHAGENRKPGKVPLEPFESGGSFEPQAKMPGTFLNFIAFK